MRCDGEKDWNVGLIVGPSGAGKSSVVMRQLFGEQTPFEWKAKSLIDDFDPKFSTCADLVEAQDAPFHLDAKIAPMTPALCGV